MDGRTDGRTDPNYRKALLLKILVIHEIFFNSYEFNLHFLQGKMWTIMEDFELLFNQILRYR